MIRIQRLRRANWTMPANCVYVGRPTIWGNPYHVGKDFTQNQAVEQFKKYAEWMLSEYPHWIDDLKGKDLACWCSLNQPCHADILIEILKAKP